MRVRSVLHLTALSVFLAGLLASAGSERNPYHAHIVIGGTQIERTRALIAHLLREETGAGNRPVFGELVPGPLGRATRARVFSLQRDDGGGLAVWSGGGALHVVSYAPIRLCPPHGSAGPSATTRGGAPQVAHSAADPPPRPV